MLRWRFILAAVGCLILTANHSTGQSPENQQAAVEAQRSADTQQAANSIAGAIRDTIRPVEKDEGCQKGRDSRDSDLCAQWKAADAARDAANYAIWTLIISAIGTGLLVWTLWETRQTARRELRAYVSISIAGLHQFSDDAGGFDKMTLEIKMKNNGGTPAYDCWHAGSIAAVPPAQAAETFENTRRSKNYTGTKAPYVIGSQQEGNGELASFESFPKDVVARIMSGELAVYAYGFCEYRDVFRKTRKTEFCYVADGITDPAKVPKAGIHLSEINWTLAPFHNNAT